MKTRILIVDDEVDALGLMDELFKRNGYETFIAHNGLEALAQIREIEPDIMISDMIMPEMDGMELLEIVRKKYPSIAVIMNTAHGTIETAVEAMKKGAKDYILKPIRLDEILSKVANFAHMSSLMRENDYLREQLNDKYNFDNIIGRTPKMLELFELIKAIAPINSTILIRGENGTGKELIAKAIHFSSKRVKKQLVDLNCGVLAENLLESELFGHVKGAFTGAIKDKIGKFELADGGTIFLDEIGEISPNIQVKLLRVLQEREFERLGGTDKIKVDVRIIAATNKDLEKAIKEQAFRQDLFYRLNVIPIEVPPLRDRADDIPILVAHFVKKYSQAFEKKIVQIDDDMIDVLQAHDWPGNIRELENVIERAIVLSKSDRLSVEDLPQNIVYSNMIAVPELQAEEDSSLTNQVDIFEKTLITRALKECNNNRVRAAKKLGIHRSTFMSKLKKHQIGGDNKS